MYLRMQGIHLRSLLEYEADFWIMVIATVLMQIVNLIFLQALFAKVPSINGWGFWPVVAMFALVAIAEGVGSLMFEGMWKLADLINRGELDYLLVRPFPVWLQVSSNGVGINGASNIITGTIMLIAALTHIDIAWSPGLALVGVLLLISAIVIKVSINLATNAVSFWSASPTPLFAMAVHQVGDLARFPLSVYPLALKLALGIVVPFAFVSFFPIGVITGKVSPLLSILVPVVAVYCAVVARQTFRRGLRRYESAGN